MTFTFCFINLIIINTTLFLTPKYKNIIMKISEKIFKLPPWSFIGVLVAIILFLLSIIIISRSRSSGIKITILNKTNILDVNLPLTDLNVEFRGENILEDSLNLCIYSIKVENIGSSNITQSMYDQNESWGLRIINGRIIEQPRLLSFKTDYIRRNLIFQVIDDTLLYFSKIIFEPADYFNLDLLVIHDMNEIPDIEFIGKIAGINNNNIEIEHKYTSVSQNKKSSPIPRWFLIVFSIGIIFSLGNSILYSLHSPIISLRKRQRSKLIKKYENKLTPQIMKIFNPESILFMKMRHFKGIKQLLINPNARIHFEMGLDRDIVRSIVAEINVIMDSLKDKSEYNQYLINIISLLNKFI